MDKPLSLKSRGQINIVLNQKELKKNFDQKSVFTDVDREKHYILEKIEKELEELVGLSEMKKFIKEIYAWLYINKCRKEQGLKVGKQVLHMIFKGNPGTGKTTVARLLAKLFKEMEVLSKGHLLEVERADLVGEYIGHTAQKTRDLVKKAVGGILFIDEAYSLARGGEKDFGKEAIDTLVKAMEDQQHDFVLILAGYSREMDHFLSLNPGLPSRFPITMKFPDYTNDELMEIAKKMLNEREYVISTEAEWKLRDYLQSLRVERSYNFSNGRLIRNVVEKAVRAQAVRLLHEGKYDRETLLTLTKDDFKMRKT
ncbi:stage V sporulation protein K [Anaerobacillus alkalilacustris]|uniref:Stage V sporulation protein K n=1 Tax=Anaerobacillus alkalilacustris TaxID=393763 RepID=A0A1S2LKP6_9BACI|nr:stage V sporulation protein K [Anaerobacillus alkalilacustris]OIJ13082.1 stage V sporulation protein K [Anaerobacillus alkalilacustris]